MSAYGSSDPAFAAIIVPRPYPGGSGADPRAFGTIAYFIRRARLRALIIALREIATRRDADD